MYVTSNDAKSYNNGKGSQLVSYNYQVNFYMKFKIHNIKMNPCFLHKTIDNYETIQNLRHPSYECRRFFVPRNVQSHTFRNMT